MKSIPHTISPKFTEIVIFFNKELHLFGLWVVILFETILFQNIFGAAWSSHNLVHK